MKRLIINADDFGLTEGVNHGVLKAHQGGIVTSTTLLANGAAFESAVALALAAPGLGVGVHLNLSQGRPVADASRVASLLNRDGCFSGGPPGLLSSVLFGKLNRAELEREWRAQIEKVRGAGIAITHLDGHKHVHMLPGVFPIVVRLAREYGIPAVRLAIERPASLGRLLRRNGGAATRLIRQRVRAHALAALAIGCRKQLRQARIHSTAYFYGITQTGFLDRAELEAILRNLPEDTSELMCHPGYADGVLRQAGTRLVEQRERELDALTRPETRNLVAALGIRLIHYGQLAAAL
jgi:hopanoid biosynthesis associated protein HpnK